MSNDTTIIQVPVTKKFRDEMVVVAEKLGFSSLQDLIRFCLTEFRNGNLRPALISKYNSDDEVQLEQIIKRNKKYT